MPQADANAFKTLKRNHALLNRKSRDAFDIYKKNTRLKPLKRVTIPKLNAEQRRSIQEKIRVYKQAERTRFLFKLIISLLITPVILYFLLDFMKVITAPVFW